MVQSEGGINLEGPGACEGDGFGWALRPWRRSKVIGRGEGNCPQWGLLCLRPRQVLDASAP